MIIVKYWKNAGNVTNNSTPAYIWLPWVITFAAAIAFYLYLRFKKDRTTMYGKVINEFNLSFFFSQNFKIVKKKLKRIIDQVNFLENL